MTRTAEDEQTAGVRISAGEFLASCALVAALAWSIHVRMRPGPALGEDAPLAQFSAARARRTLAELVPRDLPRPAGSAEHARVRESIVRALRDAGCEPQVQETLARGPTGRIAIVRNVLARIPGSDGGAAVLVCAHYDTVGASPGAADDAAGVATLIEVARAAAAGQRARNALIALFTDAGEVGNEGATAFAEQHPWMSSVAVALDLEAYGSSGPCMAVDVARNEAWMVDAIASAAHRPWLTSAHDAIFKNVPDETDSSVFRERGVAGATLAFLGQSWTNHTMRDGAAALDAASLQEQGDCALAIVRVLADLDLRRRGTGEAVFTDLLGWTIVRWRKGASLALALAALALSLATVESSRRRRIVTLRTLAIGTVACAAALAACAVGGALPIELVDVVRRGRDAGLEHPHALAAALFAGIGCTLALAALLIRRMRVPFVTLWLASSAACAFAGTLAALLRPELSGLLVLPSLAIALAGAVARVDIGCPRAWQRWLALAAPSASCAVVWWPVFEAMHLGFHYRSGWVLAAPLSVIALGSLPSAASIPRRALFAFAIASAAICVVAASLAVAGAQDRERFPDSLNLRYVVDRAPSRDADRLSNHARWEASTFGAPLPERLAAAASFERASSPPFPWLTLDRSMYVAGAPAWDVAPPSWTPSQERALGAGRIVRGTLRSPRGASRLHLHLPPQIRIESVAWNGREIRGGFEHTDTQLFFAVPPEGIEVELRVDSDLPAAFWLLDQDWTMPPPALELLEARGAGCVPRSDGDVSIVGAEISIP